MLYTIKRLVIIATILLMPSYVSAAIVQYTNSVQDRYGNAAVGVSVYVYLPGTQTQATIYSDDLGTPLSQPVLSDANSYYTFYVAEDEYDIVISKPGVVSQTRSKVRIGAKKPWIESSDYQSLSAANAAAVAANKELLITKNHTLAGHTILTAAVRVLKGGGFTKASTYTLAINGPFEAGLYQVFYGFSAGDVTFATVGIVYPEWWGIDGVADEVEINKAIIAGNGKTVKLLQKQYTIAAPINIAVTGTTLQGSGRTTVPSSGTYIVNAGTSHAIIFKTGLPQGTVENLGIFGNVGSLNGIHFEVSSIGHARLINLWIEVQQQGIDTSAGDGVHLYLESIRVYGGNVPFNLNSDGIVINNITAVNCYAQNATANSGWRISGVSTFTAINSSSDNNFYGWEVGTGNHTFIGCTAENNTSKGWLFNGASRSVLINPFTYAQLTPFEVNHSSATVIWMNPRTDATPSGSSINIQASSRGCVMLGHPLLDGGLQGASITHFSQYVNGAGNNIFKALTTNGPLGSATLSASTTTTTINNTVVTANSKIFFVPTTVNAQAIPLPIVSSIVAGTSFTLTHTNDANVDKTFDYFVIN